MTDETAETPVENESPNPVVEESIPVQENIPQPPPEVVAGEAESPVPDPIEPAQPEPIIPKQEISVEQIGNKTIEKKGDTVTITEVMQPQEVSRGTLDTKFPAPFKQNDLWKRFLEKLTGRKNKKLNKIMQIVEKSGKITNDEVEKILHVSDSTATRYLDLLEKEGKIKQIGKTGKYTYYTAQKFKEF